MKKKSLMAAALVFAMAAATFMGCGSKPEPAEGAEQTAEEQTAPPEEPSVEQEPEDSSEEREDSSKESAESSKEPEASSEEPENQASAEEITLKILCAGLYVVNEEDQYELNECTKSLIEAFENANSNIEIEFVITNPFNSPDSLVTSLGVGYPDFFVSSLVEDCPDIIWIECFEWFEWFKPYMNFSFITEDLTPCLENDNIDISIYGDDARKLYLEESNTQCGLPTSEGGVIMIAGDKYNSGHEDTAWEFIKFICGEEGLNIYAENAASLDEENEN